MGIHRAGTERRRTVGPRRVLRYLQSGQGPEFYDGEQSNVSLKDAGCDPEPGVTTTVMGYFQGKNANKRARGEAGVAHAIPVTTIGRGRFSSLSQLASMIPTTQIRPRTILLCYSTKPYTGSRTSTTRNWQLGSGVLSIQSIPIVAL